MRDNGPLNLPAFLLRKQHVMQAMSGYWEKNADRIHAIPIVESQHTVMPPLRLKEIELPLWAVHCGVEGKLLVPVEACTEENAHWTTIDWWTAGFLYLEAWHERIYEQWHGPIHSYSFRLKNWDQRAWDHAWVNRIALFLRVWASQLGKENEEQAFGSLKPAALVMTHDVDAVSKTTAIRLKQFVFNMFNILRSIRKFQWNLIAPRIKKAASFLFSREDWWKLDEIIQAEKEAGIKSHFNFYAGTGRRTIKSWLFDPGYKIRNTRVLAFIKEAAEEGHVIGLHPTYNSWNQQDVITAQKEHLATLTGNTVQTLRQHWLRFAWSKTWEAQENAGIELDTTIMFNDRPGFRISAAVQYHPWNAAAGRAHRLFSLPTVLMDSHFYDYNLMTGTERENEMRKWVEEVRKVNGTAAVLWHPHTLTNDYGWKPGFVHLLKLIR
jgi:hypothetical protein